MIRAFGVTGLVAAAVLLLSSVTPTSQWTLALHQEVARIDAETPGEMGVFIKRLRDGSRLNYQGNRDWYLASTVKIPIAIAFLRLVEQGEVSLAREVTLKKSDYVDGTGKLLWLDPGARVSTAQMLESMLTHSDSTATDMIIREIGLKRLNRMLQEDLFAGGIRELTTLRQVRHDAFGELHADVRKLDNMDFIELTKVKEPAEKLTAIASLLRVTPASLKGPLEGAFERYYRRGLNTGRLDSFGALLEKLYSGKLLSERHTAQMLELMEKMVTGEKRIKAGLPAGFRFAQKTGTQLRRACNMGIIRKPGPMEDPIVLTACLEKFNEPEQAEVALRKLGEAIGRHLE